jgi:geranylgeranyl diphosphate synthase type I
MTVDTAAAPAWLTDTRELVQPAMREAIARLDATSRDVASYHLGWVDADLRPVARGGGKAVRSALALLSARAAGAPAAVGIPGAVAVELVHNFSLLHDDLMDGDTERRHRPTAWTLFGDANAILTGDAMLALASRVLLELGTRRGATAAMLIADATLALVRGQAQDMAFETRSDVGLEECLEMAVGKTGALLAASAAIGALLADAPEPRVTALVEYGEALGLAFQLVDDLLGIWGAPEVTGKPVMSDLRARKKSLPITYALCSDTEAGAQLAVWMKESDVPDDAALQRAAALVEEAGGRDWTTAKADQMLAVADEALHRVGASAEVTAELAELAAYVVNRQS